MGGGSGSFLRHRRGNRDPLPLHEGCTIAREPGCPFWLTSTYQGKGGDSEQTPSAFSKRWGYLARKEGETGYSTTGKDHQGASLPPQDPDPSCPWRGACVCSHLTLQGTFTPSPTTRGTGLLPTEKVGEDSLSRSTQPGPLPSTAISSSQNCRARKGAPDSSSCWVWAVPFTSAVNSAPLQRFPFACELGCTSCCSPRSKVSVWGDAQPSIQSSRCIRRAGDRKDAGRSPRHLWAQSQPGKS